ncbi:hypothetical protein BJX66DRAFT_343005, partial [Aspergillus keveii]
MAKEHSLPYINFLHSPTVSLQATEAGRPFHIHRDLLASKSKSISAAFERGFQEELKGVYTFQDTSEGTLARFIEWAYTGDYPATIVPAQRTDEPAKKEESNETDKVLTAIGAQPTATPMPSNHPLPAHMRMYIFGAIYPCLSAAPNRLRRL